MNNALSFGKFLSGISNTLRIANQVIPLYNQTKPLFSNAKKAYTFIKNLKSTDTTERKTESVKSQKKEIVIKNNSPQFFI